ncbi:glycosyltransferase [Adlercreutzia aquisgranensis]|uniref:glycosyltransferase n=1 Tax=Adlercreutzia aquisgranensis TaxID=2941323 RepID=UPI00203D58C3|nr:glycosyltransferase [Adlercreutzia aquisgranensis]
MSETESSDRSLLRVLQIKQGLAIDGASMMLTNLAKAVRSYGIVFDVLLDESAAKADSDYLEVITACGGRVFSIEDAWNESRRALPLKVFKLLYSRKIMRSGGYAAAHLQTDTPSRVQMLMVAKQAGIPRRIVHSHNSSCEAARTEPKRQEKYRKKMSRVATDYIACSDVAAAWLFPDEVVKDGRYMILKNGIELGSYLFDETKRAAKRQELGIDDEVAIGCVGRLVEQKNVGFALCIMEEVVERDARAKLFIVGDGEEREALEACVREKGLGDNVLFLGARYDVPDLMQALDVLLMPSLFEGLGIVLVEAQAASLPSVVSDAVPPEADLGGRLSFLSLDDPVGIWADSLVEAVSALRVDTSEAVRKSGYTIEESARLLASLYAGKAEC